MPEQPYSSNPEIEQGLKIRDIEERQRLLRDRILLIGKNLLESKEEVGGDLGKIKRDLNNLKLDIDKIKETLATISEELGSKASRSELIILEKQLKMFSPLELARIKDVEEMLKRKHK